jgi:hypothetical protein
MQSSENMRGWLLVYQADRPCGDNVCKANNVLLLYELSPKSIPYFIIEQK